MKETKQQEKSAHRDWETPISAALGFSLGKYRDRLEKTDLVKLNSKPREIDVLIIDKKFGEERMDNAIGHLFERHNLVELKNPGEPLNIDVIWKGISYAAQYKSSGNDKTTGKKGVNAVPIDEVTLTFIRFSKPDALFDYMKKRGYRVDEYQPGVYYITGMADIRMQIVVCRELDGDEYLTLRVQGPNVSEDDISDFIDFESVLDDGSEIVAYEAIMKISMTENEETYNKVKEGNPKMSEAWERIMKDEIVARENEKVIADREKNAKLMLIDSKPLSEITKYTGVPESRIRELAAEAGLKIIN